jgi:hypothetical protein
VTWSSLLRNEWMDLVCILLFAAMILTRSTGALKILMGIIGCWFGLIGILMLFIPMPDTRRSADPTRKRSEI